MEHYIDYQLDKCGKLFYQSYQYSCLHHMVDMMFHHVFQLLFLVDKELDLKDYQHNNVLVDILCIVMNHSEYYNNQVDNQYMLFVEYH
jgi:hypothetical protein